jgi:hypothetical protein
VSVLPPPMMRPGSRQSRMSFSRPFPAAGTPLAKASPTTALTELPPVAASPFLESPTSPSPPAAPRARSGSRTPRVGPAPDITPDDSSATLPARRRTASYHVPRSGSTTDMPRVVGLAGLVSGWGASFGRRRRTELALPAVASDDAAEAVQAQADAADAGSKARELLRRF